MTEVWFDPPTAGIVGGVVGTAVGLWGAAVGGLAAWLIPRNRGRAAVFGLIGAGAAGGVAALVAGVAALAGGQPYHVWYAVGYPGLLVLILAGPAGFVVRRRYRAAEGERMAAQDFG